ncbi:Dpp9 [Symbiodinium microadriaticum]|nr:Dpp9 [Symbiodinium microadriaticum]
MPPQFYRLDVPHIRGGLNCCVYRPDPAVHGEGPYACVVSCYGGPSVQRVTNTWTATADLRVQRLVQSGAVVLKVDNRGSTRRGLEFERSIRWSMGGVEIEDQQWAVKHFVDSGLIDASRVGIYGWSYGGYMSLMALCRASETFCCGVAGAPVTSWDGYDSHYTERYMGLPADNPSGYNCSSVMTHVSGLPTGRLMLMHGLIDENVHFRHTARLVAAITAARKKYDLVLFPDQRHGPRSLEGVIYLEDRIIDFFSEHLRLL